jgi:hypothetical protein
MSALDRERNHVVSELRIDGLLLELTCPFHPVAGRLGNSWRILLMMMVSSEA